MNDTFSPNLRSKKEHRLPSILSRKEVFRVLKHIKTFQNFASLSSVCACGLRISETLGLQVSDIDGKRMMVHVHHGTVPRRRTQSTS